MKIRIRNKKLVIGVFAVMIACTLVTTAGMLSYYAEINTKATAHQSVQLWHNGDWQNWDQSFSWDVEPVGSECFSKQFTIKNQADVEESITLETRVFHDSDWRLPSSLDSFDVNYIGLHTVGIQDYTVPSADHTVDGTSIQTGIDGASDNDVIVVKTGSYDGFIVDKPLTLVADGVVTIDKNPPSSATAMVQVAASDVTIEGFIIDSESKNYAVENTHNEDNMVLKNNKFIGNIHGVYINPSAGTLIEYNEFNVSGVAIGSDGHTGTIVRNNIFTDTISTEVMGASGTYDVVFTGNHIYTTAPLADYSSGSGDFDATGNYFAEGIHTSGTVTATHVDLDTTTLQPGEQLSFTIEYCFTKPCPVFWQDRDIKTTIQ
jgi:hypothetical protein